MAFCTDCGSEFEKTGKNHRRCGSVKKKSGCSYSYSLFSKSHTKEGKLRMTHYSINYRVSGENVLKAKELRQEIKKEVMMHYGSRCVCCPEDNLMLLTIDHIENDGHTFKGKKGKLRLKGTGLYLYLKKKKYPKNVQILCFNCNIGRQNNGGVCPHQSHK